MFIETRRSITMFVNLYRVLAVLFHNFRLNIILLSTCWSYKWPLSIRFFDQIPNGVLSLTWFPHVLPALSYCCFILIFVERYRSFSFSLCSHFDWR